MLSGVLRIAPLGHLGSLMPTIPGPWHDTTYSITKSKQDDDTTQLDPIYLASTIPTGHFKSSQPKNPSVHELYVVQKRWRTKLQNVWSCTKYIRDRPESKKKMRGERRKRKWRAGEEKRMSSKMRNVCVPGLLLPFFDYLAFSFFMRS